MFSTTAHTHIIPLDEFKTALKIEGQRVTKVELHFGNVVIETEETKGKETKLT